MKGDETMKSVVNTESQVWNGTMSFTPSLGKRATEIQAIEWNGKRARSRVRIISRLFQSCHVFPEGVLGRRITPFTKDRLLSLSHSFSLIPLLFSLFHHHDAPDLDQQLLFWWNTFKVTFFSNSFFNFLEEKSLKFFLQLYRLYFFIV